MSYCDWKCRLKNVWRSKTIWFNTVLVPALSVGFTYLEQTQSMLQPYLGDKYLYLIGFTVAGNFILRVITHTDLKDK